MRPFVGGWVSEWVGAYVCPSRFTLWTWATTVFAQSLSNFTCKLWMMRGGTLFILGHRIKGQRQLCPPARGYHALHCLVWFHIMKINIQVNIRPRKKICVFTVRRPTLIFGPDPKLFYCTFSRKLFKYPIFAFKSSFWCLSDNYFDKNELNVTLQV